jgi:hypothetical protein
LSCEALAKQGALLWLFPLRPDIGHERAQRSRPQPKEEEKELATKEHKEHKKRSLRTFAGKQEVRG